MFASLFVVALSVAAPTPSTQALGPVLDCRSERNDQARLRCFDAAAAALVAATDAGTIVVVDREDIRRTRRSLFGFSLPKLPFFAGDKSQDDEPDVTEATIASARSLGADQWSFVLADGAVWRTTEASRNATPRAGTSVRLKKAALGSYMASFGGARSVRAMRVR